MGINLDKEPELKDPLLLAGWPGIGNIGILAINTLRVQVQAENLGEIEPWDFFYPNRVTIKEGLLQKLEFPRSCFYYKKLKKRDVIFFIGEEQPSEGRGTYAEGEKASKMANLVLDVAEKFGCRRVVTSGAAVSLTHHTLKPRACVVVSSPELERGVKEFQNVFLMSEIESKAGEGIITGLNGLLLALAKRRGLESICLMGEIADWIAQVPQPYPKASRSVLEVLGQILEVEIDFSPLDRIAADIDEVINTIYEKFPIVMKEKYDQRIVTQMQSSSVTEEDATWLKQHIDELFPREDRGHEEKYI